MLSIQVSQCSVVMHLRYGGNFYDGYISLEIYY